MYDTVIKAEELLVKLLEFKEGTPRTDVLEVLKKYLQESYVQGGIDATPLFPSE